MSPLFEKWQTWAALAATVAFIGNIGTIVTTLIDVQEKFWPAPLAIPASAPNDKPEVAAGQPLNGTIFGEQSRRLSGVQVKLPEFKKLATTDEQGRFEFSVKAPEGQRVELIAEKLGYKTEERFASVGNPHNDFTMEKVLR